MVVFTCDQSVSPVALSCSKALPCAGFFVGREPRVMFERGGRCWRQGPETKKAAQGCWRDARYGWDVERMCQLCSRIFLQSPKTKKAAYAANLSWLRGQDLNLRPSGYEPDELPSCSTPRLNECIIGKTFTPVNTFLRLFNIFCTKEPQVAPQTP